MYGCINDCLYLRTAPQFKCPYGICTTSDARDGVIQKGDVDLASHEMARRMEPSARRTQMARLVYTWITTCQNREMQIKDRRELILDGGLRDQVVGLKLCWSDEIMSLKYEGDLQNKL